MGAIKNELSPLPEDGYAQNTFERMPSRLDGSLFLRRKPPDFRFIS
jgi:hypothetical protein